MDVRVARLERSAESDDNTLQSILLILERMDQRLAAHDEDFATLKLDVGTLKSDMETMKREVGALREGMVAVKDDVETLVTVTDVLKLKVATIESTTADTNRRVTVRGFSE